MIFSFLRYNPRDRCCEKPNILRLTSNPFSTPLINNIIPTALCAEKRTKNLFDFRYSIPLALHKSYIKILCSFSLRIREIRRVLLIRSVLILNEGCRASRNIYPLDCTAGTRESYVTNRFSFTLAVHISYAYELPCRSIIIPIVSHRKPKDVVISVRHIRFIARSHV